MDPKAIFATRLVSSLLHEVVVDTALETHSALKRARRPCACCGKDRCGSHGTFDAGAGANGTKPDYYSNNPLFECLVCSRQVSSNRYATHLEKCMGMGAKTSRKGCSRMAKSNSNAATSSLLNSGTRSASPAQRTDPGARKRGTSPTPLRPDAESKHLRMFSEPRTSEPYGARASVHKGAAQTPPDESTAADKPQAKPADAAPVAVESSAGEVTGDASPQLFGDLEQGFSVSSDSDDSTSDTALSDVEEQEVDADADADGLNDNDLSPAEDSDDASEIEVEVDMDSDENDGL
ncbi:hypothetical protein MSPP1_002707 [Malassezia sp. CBS 17886]|nr:hypothetical protein MSPP1_002707 [Malassezia sp. CBS 17886]